MDISFSGKEIAIYIHWPFCLSKCPYCDFNSHTSSAIDVEQWKRAYLKEIEYFKHKISGRYISSIFFGGGTPSLMPPSLVEFLISTLSFIATIDSNTEITLEANPTSVEMQKFKNFRLAGINRVSIGVQSLRLKDLEFLGRKHDIKEAISAIQLAQDIFANSSFDLIYARPSQTLEDWMLELEDAMALASSHISLYQLTIEKGTPFYKQHREKDFLLPNSDLAADMYNATNEYLLSMGYSNYEISNYAIPGYESSHNLTYWNYGEYLGLGPGAHSRIEYDDGYFSIMNISLPQKWLNSVLIDGSGVQRKTLLSSKEITEELLMMGLRLKNGIDDSRLYYLTGKNFVDILNQSELDKYINMGFLRFKNDRLVLTNKGLLLHNYIVSRLV